ncbi:MAG: Hsp70 family protein [Candidatus Delongbacteria bacterium]|jgi:molecular chaperone DnaK|nr:Hsp70 family protein [Candidatus Delongbacteria bacterium]
MKLIGIDLGTTNSAIALVNEFGKAEIIPNKEGERITPSVVLFDDDQTIVGSIAKQSSVAEPDKTVSSIKAHIGSSDFHFTNNGTEYTPEDISAMILRKLIDDAEQYLNETITDVVITVPAYFNDKQRKATIDAGKVSGVNVLQIINEPTAAALTYGLDKKIEQKIMVYDLGGGTFDVTIMQLNEGNFDVIASDGDRQLGGDNFDEKLMVYINEKFKQQHEIDLFEDPVFKQDLRLKSENAKKVLSSKISTTVYLSAAGKSTKLTITRKLFADLVADFVTRTELLINAVMTDADLEWENIDQVLLVGGSTRMPAVHDMITRVTGQKPSSQINPDEAVALGAAIQAGILSAKDESDQEVNAMVRMKYGAINISDVTAHSFGAITLDEFDNKRNAVVIPKNSKIPVRKSQIFYTSIPKQSQVKMIVIQGEDPDPEFCTTIGTTTLNFPPKDAGQPIIFNYEYDVNGIIHATAKDPDTGKKSAIKITREGELSGDQVRQKAGQINNMFPRRREYLATNSFADGNFDDVLGTENSPNEEDGANMVNDVFDSKKSGDSETLDPSEVFNVEKIQEDADDILQRSEMETVTSKDLANELGTESKTESFEDNEAEEERENKEFLEREMEVLESAEKKASEDNDLQDNSLNIEESKEEELTDEEKVNSYIEEFDDDTKTVLSEISSTGSKIEEEDEEPEVIQEEPVSEEVVEEIKKPQAQEETNEEVVESEKTTEELETADSEDEDVFDSLTPTESKIEEEDEEPQVIQEDAFSDEVVEEIKEPQAKEETNEGVVESEEAIEELETTDSENEDVFDSLTPTESKIEEEDDNTEEQTEADIEKSFENITDDDEFDNISMEDSSVQESQSFDEDLDEIGKSEFIIDRSEYLTDEDIMRIKEDDDTKSGDSLSEQSAVEEESFTEDDVNELFSNTDSKKILSTENDQWSDIEPEKSEEDKKNADKVDESTDDSLLDWID